MREYIEREAVKKVLCENWCKWTGESCDAEEVCGLFAFVDEAPAADVAPVRHGRWVLKGIRQWEFADDRQWQCSVCERTEWRVKTKYCPNCGAKMDLE